MTDSAKPNQSLHIIIEISDIMYLYKAMSAIWWALHSQSHYYTVNICLFLCYGAYDKLDLESN